MCPQTQTDLGRGPCLVALWMRDLLKLLLLQATASAFLVPLVPAVRLRITASWLRQRRLPRLLRRLLLLRRAPRHGEHIISPRHEQLALFTPSKVGPPLGGPAETGSARSARRPKPASWECEAPLEGRAVWHGGGAPLGIPNAASEVVRFCTPSY